MLAASHGITPAEIRPVPGGFAARCFEVVSPGSRVFLKVWPDTESGRRNGAQQPVLLPALDALARSGFEPATAALPGRDGRLPFEVDGLPYAVFPFVDGEPLASPLSESAARALGTLLARLHASAPAVAHLLPFADPYDVSFLERLRGAMVRMRLSVSTGRPAIGSLRTPLLEREGEVQRRIDQLIVLRDRVAGSSTTLVPCHRDLGGPNVRIRLDGSFAFVDWDDFGWAPPEHDLQFANEEPEFAALLEAYRSAGGSQQLSADQVEFFLARRYLFDITARLLRVLDDNRASDDDTRVMFGLHAYRCDEWDTFDARMRHVRQILG